MSQRSGGTIIFITGTFLGHHCWDEWKLFFEKEGYHCIAPAWPYKEADTEELRNLDSDSAIASNRLCKLTDYFAAIAASLDEKPILIGHSLGGLIVQLLLQQQLGVAGVAIHSFPPKGSDSFRFLFLKAIWQAMGLFTPTTKTYLMPFAKWKKLIAYGMASQLQKDSYYEYAVPESKKIIRDIFSRSAKIDFKKSHPPILFTSGSNDKLISSSLNYGNYKRYTTGNTITDYVEFEGHAHLVFDHPACRKEADFILYWLQELKQPQPFELGFH